MKACRVHKGPGHLWGTVWADLRIIGFHDSVFSASQNGLTGTRGRAGDITGKDWMWPEYSSGEPANAGKLDAQSDCALLWGAAYRFSGGVCHMYWGTRQQDLSVLYWWLYVSLQGLQGSDSSLALCMGVISHQVPSCLWIWRVMRVMSHKSNWKTLVNFSVNIMAEKLDLISKFSVRFITHSCEYVKINTW